MTEIGATRNGDMSDAAKIRAVVSANWKWMLVVVVVVWAGAIVFAFLSTPVYRAQVVLVPAEPPPKAGSLASLAGQFGGLASLAGLDESTNPQTNEAIAVLKSRAFLEAYLRDENLLPVLFASRWDSAKSAWKPSWHKTPDYWQGYRLLTDHVLSIDKDKKLGTITLTVIWRNRQAAAQWANQLVGRINAAMRARALEDATRKVAYLEDQLAATNVVGVQNAIGQLIEQSMETKMMAAVEPQYAFQVIDPAMVPDRRDVYRPNRILYIALGPFVGFVIAGAALFVLDLFRK